MSDTQWRQYITIRSRILTGSENGAHESKSTTANASGYTKKENNKADHGGKYDSDNGTGRQIFATWLLARQWQQWNMVPQVDVGWPGQLYRNELGRGFCEVDVKWGVWKINEQKKLYLFCCLLNSFLYEVSYLFRKQRLSACENSRHFSGWPSCRV